MNALLLLGVVAVGVAPIVWYFSEAPPASNPRPQTVAGVEPERGAGPLEREQRSQPPVVAVAIPAGAGGCALAPLVPPMGARDGHARAEHPFPGGPRTKVKVFVRAAERAAARGRLRDSELALIAACEQAERVSPSPSVLLARVLGRLGDHYVHVARRVQDSPLRSSLVERAREARMRSVEIYAVTLGPNASTTRRAQQLLRQLDEGLPGPDGEAEQVVVRPSVPVQREAAARAAPVRAAPARNSPPPQPQTEPAAAPPAPATPAQRTFEDSPEFRQLASDLARLRSQAEAVSDDPAGLRRRGEAARAQKERCEDAACLRQWYANRKRELLGEF